MKVGTSRFKGNGGRDPVPSMARGERTGFSTQDGSGWAPCMVRRGKRGALTFQNEVTRSKPVSEGPRPLAVCVALPAQGGPPRARARLQGSWPGHLSHLCRGEEPFPGTGPGLGRTGNQSVSGTDDHWASPTWQQLITQSFSSTVMFAWRPHFGEVAVRITLTPSPTAPLPPPPRLPLHASWINPFLVTNSRCLCSTIGQVELGFGYTGSLKPPHEAT